MAENTTTEDIEKFLQQHKLPEKLESWLKSKDFAKSWKGHWAEGMNSAKVVLEESSPKMNVRAYIRNGGLWVELREPMPKVRLITYEIQQHVEPLKVFLRAWIYEEDCDLYETMQQMGNQTFIGQEWRVQKTMPTPSWAKYVLNSEHKVLGLGYISHDLKFFSDRKAISDNLKNLSNEFIDFVFNASSAE